MNDLIKNQSVLEFEVHDGGTLTVANFAKLTTRAEFYEDIADRWADSKQELFDAMTVCQPLAWEVQSIYSEARIEIEVMLCDVERDDAENAPRITELQTRLAYLPEEPEDGAARWLLSLSDREFESCVIPAIKKWFDEEPSWGDEEDYLPSGMTAQGAAFDYFRNMDDSILDLLGVAIVEGDRPGSTYYAAELEKDLAEANGVAVEHNLNIRFVVARN